MKITIILMLCVAFLILLFTGCTDYSDSTFSVHPCNQPVYLNLSCEELRGCAGSDQFHESTREMNQELYERKDCKTKEQQEACQKINQKYNECKNTTRNTFWDGNRCHTTEYICNSMALRMGADTTQEEQEKYNYIDFGVLNCQIVEEIRETKTCNCEVTIKGVIQSMGIYAKTPLRSFNRTIEITEEQRPKC